MSLVFATTFFFCFFFLVGWGGVLRHSAVQTDFEFEISGSLPLSDFFWYLGTKGKKPILRRLYLSSLFSKFVTSITELLMFSFQKLGMFRILINTCPVLEFAKKCFMINNERTLYNVGTG